MSLSSQQVEFWSVPEFDNLELFRAGRIRYSYARHAHPGYAIGVIEAGVGGNFYRGSTYLAPPRSVVFMNPEEAHTGYSAEDQPLTYRMLYPSVSLIQQIASEAQLSGTPYFRDAVIQDEALARAVLSLHVVLEQSQDQLERQSRLAEVLPSVLLCYADVKAQTAPSKEEHRAVHLIKEYLHDNYGSNISLNDLATITALNRAYLVRIFRQAVGMPPYAYLTQIRIRKAKQLLDDGMSVVDTAIAVGLSDQSHLNRHFKRILGITPGYYRRMSTSFKTI